MLLASYSGIKKSFGDLTVLKDVSFDISTGEVMGLVGRNGAGKTTLAEIISGNIQADAGVIKTHKDNLRIGYLLQSTDYSEKIFQEMVKKGSRRGTGEFFTVTSYLGLKGVQGWEKGRFNELSGGEKTKLALADIWISRPDLLLLDEPTNHLDFQGIQWLIEQIKKFQGAVLIISHDRYFLDQTVKRVFELEDGKIESYKGNYTYYRREKNKLFKIRLHHYQELIKEERKLEAQIDQLDNWADKANRDARKVAVKNGRKFGGKEFYRSKAKKMNKQVKSRRKMLLKKKQEGIDRPEEEPEVNFDFKVPDKRGKRVLEGISMEKSFGNKNLFKNSSFYIQHGEKIGIYGDNGCGKTTFLRILLGDEQLDKGELWVSPTLKTGYLSQDVMDLDVEKNPLEILGIDRNPYSTRARTLLAGLGFTEQMLDKKIGSLSLGERTRIKLAHLVLQENDCLILDEPNNHLDLYCREQLEETLLDFPGTLLVVSHDRYMLEKLCNKMLVFEDKQLRRVERGFKEYRERANSKSDSDRMNEKKREEKMVIENKIARTLASLEKYTSADPEYEELEQEFHKLVTKKREIKRLT